MLVTALWNRSVSMADVLIVRVSAMSGYLVFNAVCDDTCSTETAEESTRSNEVASAFAIHFTATLGEFFLRRELHVRHTVVMSVAESE